MVWPASCPRLGLCLSLGPGMGYGGAGIGQCQDRRRDRICELRLMDGLRRPYDLRVWAPCVCYSGQRQQNLLQILRRAQPLRIKKPCSRVCPAPFPEPACHQGSPCARSQAPGEAMGMLGQRLIHEHTEQCGSSGSSSGPSSPGFLQ